MVGDFVYPFALCPGKTDLDTGRLALRFPVEHLALCRVVCSRSTRLYARPGLIPGSSGGRPAPGHPTSPCSLGTVWRLRGAGGGSALFALLHRVCAPWPEYRPPRASHPRPAPPTGSVAQPRGVDAGPVRGGRALWPVGSLCAPPGSRECNLLAWRSGLAADPQRDAHCFCGGGDAVWRLGNHCYGHRGRIRPRGQHRVGTAQKGPLSAYAHVELDAGPHLLCHRNQPGTPQVLAALPAQRAATVLGACHSRGSQPIHLCAPPYPDDAWMVCRSIARAIKRAGWSDDKLARSLLPRSGALPARLSRRRAVYQRARLTGRSDRPRRRAQLSCRPRASRSTCMRWRAWTGR
jgi:hypothetical protein